MLLKIKSISTLLVFFIAFSALAQEKNQDLLNLLLKKGIISQTEADSLLKESNKLVSKSSGDKEFSVALEFRPRTEYRNGYRRIRTADTEAAFFTDQRSRLYLNYKMKNFIFHTSIQDIRVWGEQDPRSTDGSLQVFEAYVEPTIAKNLSIRVGRQKIMYDNQRLFAQNNWRQNGGAHDAVRLIYKNKKLEGDLIAAFNQEKGAQNRFFEIDFSPEGFNNYKYLFANFLKYNATDKLTLTGINVADGFQDPENTKTNHARFTSGGRIEYTNGDFYYTLAGYFQYGRTPVGQSLSAFYFQPEIKYTPSKRWTFRLGAEIFSGDNDKKSSATSKSFDPLYGVNHRFLGSMDFFTRFPNDLNNAGLIAPYLFNFYKVNEKLTLRSDYHLFYSSNNFIPAGETEPQDKFLGFENDLLIRFNPNKYTEIDLGYSYAFITRSMERIQNRISPNAYQDWAFVMVTFKPELFNWKN